MQNRRAVRDRRLRGLRDDLTDDGASTACPPRVETFDNAFLECPDCGWKLEKVEVRIVDRTLHEEIH